MIEEFFSNSNVILSSILNLILLIWFWSNFLFYLFFRVERIVFVSNSICYWFMKTHVIIHNSIKIWFTLKTNSWIRRFFRFLQLLFSYKDDLDWRWIKNSNLDVELSNRTSMYRILRRISLRKLIDRSWYDFYKFQIQRISTRSSMRKLNLFRSRILFHMSFSNLSTQECWDVFCCVQSIASKRFLVYWFENRISWSYIYVESRHETCRIRSRFRIVLWNRHNVLLHEI